MASSRFSSIGPPSTMHLPNVPDELSSGLCDGSASPGRQSLLKVEQSLFAVLNIHKLLPLSACYY